MLYHAFCFSINVLEHMPVLEHNIPFLEHNVPVLEHNSITGGKNAKIAFKLDFFGLNSK